MKQRYQSELDSLQKRSLKELEKLEQQQVQEYKTKTKQLKSEQVMWAWFVSMAYEHPLYASLKSLSDIVRIKRKKKKKRRKKLRRKQRKRN